MSWEHAYQGDGTQVWRAQAERQKGSAQPEAHAAQQATCADTSGSGMPHRSRGESIAMQVQKRRWSAGGEEGAEALRAQRAQML